MTVDMVFALAHSLVMELTSRITVSVLKLSPVIEVHFLVIVILVVVLSELVVCERVSALILLFTTRNLIPLPFFTVFGIILSFGKLFRFPSPIDFFQFL